MAERQARRGITTDSCARLFRLRGLRGERRLPLSIASGDRGLHTARDDEVRFQSNRLRKNVFKLKVMKRLVSLNPHAFRRIFATFTYVENQVNHVSVVLTGKEKELVDKLSRLPQIVECADGIVERLRALWILAYDGDEIVNFSYANKKDIEQRFGNMSSELPRLSEPWLKTLQVELTDACNERCIHCYLPNKKKDTAREIDLSAMKRLLNEFRQMNGLRIVFSGGEILLYQHLFELLNYCRELDLMIFLQSNLLTLTPAQIEKIKALDVFNVQVSLYSVLPEEHDAITARRGSCLHTMQSIKAMAENDIPMVIACPIMSKNFGSIGKIKAFADAIGADYYFDDIMMAQTGGNCCNLEVRIDSAVVSQVVEEQLRMNSVYMEAIIQSKSIDELMSKRFARRMATCSILDSGLCIDSDGTAYPCPGWNKMAMGNIFDDSLSHIWTGGQLAARLRNTVPSLFAKCKKCRLHNFCNMCAVYNYNEMGDMATPCPRFCEEAKMLRNCVINIYKQIKKTI